MDKVLGILILVSDDVDDDGSRDHCDIIGMMAGDDNHLDQGVVDNASDNIETVNDRERYQQLVERRTHLRTPGHYHHDANVYGYNNNDDGDVYGGHDDDDEDQ